MQAAKRLAWGQGHRRGKARGRSCTQAPPGAATVNGQLPIGDVRKGTLGPWRPTGLQHRMGGSRGRQEIIPKVQFIK